MSFDDSSTRSLEHEITHYKKCRLCSQFILATSARILYGCATDEAHEVILCHRCHCALLRSVALTVDQIAHAKVKHYNDDP